MAIRFACDAGFRSLASWVLKTPLKNAAIYNGADFVAGYLVNCALNLPEPRNKLEMKLARKGFDGSQIDLWATVIIETASRTTGLVCGVLAAYACKQPVRPLNAIGISVAGFIGTLVYDRVESWREGRSDT